MEKEERKALKGILDLIRHLVCIGDTIIDGNVKEHDVWSGGIVGEAMDIRMLLNKAVLKSQKRR